MAVISQRHSRFARPGLAAGGRAPGAAASAVRTLCAALAGALLLFSAVPAKADHGPTNVQVTAGDGTLAVTWTRGTGIHFTQYKAKSASSWTGLRSHAATVSSFTFTSLTNGTTYEVRVGVNVGGQNFHWASAVEGTPVVGSYSIADATAAEGATATLTVTLTANSPSPDGLTLSVTADAAASDVGTVPSTVTVAAGSSTGTLSIPIARDGVEESNETFTVTISTTDTTWAAGDGSATVTITDATEEISFSSTTVSVAEGSSAALVVRRSGSTTAAASFTYATSATGATAATSDYTAASGQSASIASGSTSTTISVATAQDALVELDETFKVTLSATASDGWATGGDATVTITDATDRAAAKIAFGSNAAGTTAYTASISESGGTLNVPVTVSHLPGSSTTFGVEVGSGSATDGTDFSAPTSISFGPSDTSMTKTVTITITGDDVDEDNETIALSIAAADATPDDPGDHYTRHASGSTATLTITDDDTAGVTVTGGPLSVYEGGDTATYTVALTSRPVADVTITPTSSDAGQAAVSPATLTFVASSASDWKTEKTFTVTGGSVSASTTVTISHAAAGTDAKYPSGLSIDGVAVTVMPLHFSIASTASEDEGSTAALTVTLNRPPAADLEFSVTPTYGSGAGKAAAADLGSVPQSVTVPMGSTSATLSIPIARDADEEDDETFTVAIATAAPYWEKTSSGADTATVTITDTTEGMRLLGADGVSAGVRVTEGDITTLTVTRTGSTDRSVPFRVHVHRHGGTAHTGANRPGQRVPGGKEFNAATVPGTFAPGDSSVTVSLQTVEDDVDEGDTLFVALLAVDASTGYRILLTDDVTPGPHRARLLRR